jgi:MFS family permease
MIFGAIIVRVPAEGWKPEGWQPKASAAAPIQVSVDQAWKTPQFWLLWVVLCMNVSAGIGILGRASDIVQDMFLLSGAEGAAIGGGFVGLISLFNMGGRFIWSSFSDVIGRKAVYCVYFILGGILYSLLPWTQETQSRLLFVVFACIIISMYGGGFSTIPAYLRDMFGTFQVGAIHGRLITAWSMAAVIGPQLVNKLFESRVAAGIPKAEAYNGTLRMMCVLLAVGLVANLLVRPVHAKHHLKQLAKDQ